MLTARTGSPPPPLTTWQQVWRNLFAVLFGPLVLVSMASPLWKENSALLWVDLGLGVVSLVLMQWRRRWPLPVALAISAAGLLSVTSSGPWVVAAVSVATRRQWREIIPVGAVSLAAAIGYRALQPADVEPWLLTIGFSAVVIAVVIAVGMYIGARRDLIASLQERAERAEREQQLRVAQAQATERARIGREMHDVLAHRISLVAMHAGALAYRTDLGPEDTRRAAEVIQGTAHQALTDLREVLGLLRETSPTPASKPVPEAPQPALSEVGDLVEQARVAGMRVTFTDEVRDPELVPDAVGRSAYRMVQESLTNARKHAPHAPVQLRLHGSPGSDLHLEVRNPVPTVRNGASSPDSGLGLLGLTERASLVGGRFEHETTSDGMFVVRAWLPWPA